jgi:NTE family protein
MAAHWKRVTRQDVYPGNVLNAAWRFLRGENSLYANDGLRRMIRGGLPVNVTTFGDLKLPLYVATVDLLSSRLFIFGEDRRTPLLDAIVASATIPVLHPPVAYHGLQLVDGGVLANAAASVAMDKGARQVYVLNAGYKGNPLKPPKGVVEVANHTLTTMMAQSLLEDLARARADLAIDLHHVMLSGPAPQNFDEFGQVDELIQTGYEQTRAYLSAPRPHVVAPMSSQPTDLGEVAPGVREFVPPYWAR